MDGNRDEAQRALKLAQSYQTSDPVKSLKLANKACSLYWSPEAAALVRALTTGEGPSSSDPQNKKNQNTKPSSNSATSTSTKTTSDSGHHLRSRTTPKPSAPSSNSTSSNFKPAQLEIVKKVRRHQVTQYYEILELKRDCDESQIKSAYRKLALALHPDKNNAPGADEAFKMVSKAFQVLSDPEKRSAYDRHGADPDSRSAGVPTNSPFGSSTGTGTHFAYDDGIDPDQLFRMFFGGGFDHPGMQFGGGPTVFQFGGGHTAFRRGPTQRMWSQNQGFRRNQNRNQNEPEVRTPSTWISFLPLLVFFLVSLFQSFPSLFSSSSIPDPSISWTPNSIYPIQRVTHGSPGVTYYVNPMEFATHPIYETYIKANPHLKPTTASPADETTTTTKNGEKSLEEKKRLVEDLISESSQLITKRPIERQRLVIPKEFRRFENDIESSWIRKLQLECQSARNFRDAKKRDLMGFLGIRPDWEAIKKLEAEIIPACEGLKVLGYIIH